MIKWTTTHLESLPDGSTGTFQIGVPTEKFWEEWHSNKHGYRAAGYSVFAIGPPAKKIFYVKKFLRKTQAEPPPRELAGIPQVKLLYPYQREHLKALTRAMDLTGSVLDGSDTGTGKTPVALILSMVYRLRPAIICPKSVVPAWIRWCDRLEVKPVFVANWEAFKGNKNPFGQLEKRYYPYKISGYLGFPGRVNPERHFPTFAEASDFVGAVPLDYVAWEGRHNKKFPRNKCREVGNFYWQMPNDRVMLIFDEVHKAKAPDTQNARMLIAARGFKTACLSATAGKSPLDFKGLGYILGLHQLYDFHEWKRHHGCVKGRWNEWRCNEPEREMKLLSDVIYPNKGVRMRVADIPDFPETQIIAESYAIDTVGNYNKMYHSLLARCRTLEKEGARYNEVLTQILRYRQAAELLKAPLLAELAVNAMETGHSAVIFVNYSETRETLAALLQTDSMIYGTQKAQDRERIRLEFQADERRSVICQIDAGGLGLDLHDIHGNHPRMSFLCPTWVAVTLKQALGRIHRSGAKSKSIQRLVYAAGTIEERVCKKVNEYLNCIEALNDGDLYEADILNLLENYESSST